MPFTQLKIMNYVFFYLNGKFYEYLRPYYTGLDTITYDYIMV